MPTFEVICAPFTTAIKKIMDKLSSSSLQTLRSHEEAEDLMGELASFAEDVSEKGVCIVRLVVHLLRLMNSYVVQITDPERLFFLLEILNKMCEDLPDIFKPFINMDITHSISRINARAMTTIKRRNSYDLIKYYKLDQLNENNENEPEKTEEFQEHLKNRTSKCDYCRGKVESDNSKNDLTLNTKKRRLSKSLDDSNFFSGVSISGTAANSEAINDPDDYLKQVKKSSRVSSNYSVSGRASGIKVPSNGKSIVLLNALPVSHHQKKRGRPRY